HDVAGDLQDFKTGSLEMALQTLIELVWIGGADDELLAVHRLERLDFGGQTGGDRDAEFVREFFAELTVAAERQSSKERRAAEDDRIAIVIDQILDGFLDATQLFFKVAVDQLTHRAGGVEHHESFGKHFVKL